MRPRNKNNAARLLTRVQSSPKVNRLGRSARRVAGETTRSDQLTHVLIVSSLKHHIALGQEHEQPVGKLRMAAHLDAMNAKELGFR